MAIIEAKLQKGVKVIHTMNLDHLMRLNKTKGSVTVVRYGYTEDMNRLFESIRYLGYRVDSIEDRQGIGPNKYTIKVSWK